MVAWLVTLPNGGIAHRAHLQARHRQHADGENADADQDFDQGEPAL
jgi:hypothetical protein